MADHKARTKSGLLYGQQIECPSQKIGHCQNSFALWTGLLYGQKVVCFMDRFALWSKSGLLYGPRPIKLGQKVVCFMVNKSVLIRVRTPPIILDLVLNKGGSGVSGLRDPKIFACGARFTLRNPTLGA